MIHIKCPKCGDYLSVPLDRVGQSETCPNCGNITIVPDVCSNSKSSFPEDKEKKKIFLFGIASDNDPSATAWVFGTIAICMVVGALIGAPRIEPEDPIVGVLAGGGCGLILGIFIGGAIAYARQSKK